MTKRKQQKLERFNRLFEWNTGIFFNQKERSCGSIAFISWTIYFHLASKYILMIYESHQNLNSSKNQMISMFIDRNVPPMCNGFIVIEFERCQSSVVCWLSLLIGTKHISSWPSATIHGISWWFCAWPHFVRCVYLTEMNQMKSGNGNKYIHTDMTSWDKRHIRSNEVAVDNLSKLSRLKMLTGLVIGSH